VCLCVCVVRMFLLIEWCALLSLPSLSLLAQRIHFPIVLSVLFVQEKTKPWWNVPTDDIKNVGDYTRREIRLLFMADGNTGALVCVLMTSMCVGCFVCLVVRLFCFALLLLLLLFSQGMEKELGKGAGGSVWKCNLWGNTVAVKIWSSGKLQEAPEDYYREINVLMKVQHLCHPNLVQMIGAVTLRGSFAIVQEFCSRGMCF
jgi:serine/threonine protein kinase